jgi:hypothetical protein
MVPGTDFASLKAAGEQLRLRKGASGRMAEEAVKKAEIQRP